MRIKLPAAAAMALLLVTPVVAQSKQEITGQSAAGAELRSALGDDAADFWIYEDVAAGIARSKQTGKPLLVSIR